MSKKDHKKSQYTCKHIYFVFDSGTKMIKSIYPSSIYLRTHTHKKIPKRKMILDETHVWCVLCVRVRVCLYKMDRKSDGANRLNGFLMVSLLVTFLTFL